MTRCVCFQPDRLSCRIEKVSAKDGEMDGRNTNRPVRYHGRIGFTSHERELLHRIQQQHPLGAKSFTKAGIRKMIARLHEELAVYEGKGAR